MCPPYDFTDDELADIDQIAAELQPLSDDEQDALADVLAWSRIHAARSEQR